MDGGCLLQSMNYLRYGTHEDLAEVLLLLADLIKSSKLKTFKYDISKIAEVYNKLIKAPRNQAVVIIAEENNKIVGFIGGAISEVTYSKQKTAVELALYSTSQNPKVFINLMNAYMQWAKENGCETVQCHSLEGPYAPKLRKILKKAGYTKIEEMWMKEI